MSSCNQSYMLETMKKLCAIWIQFKYCQATVCHWHVLYIAQSSSAFPEAARRGFCLMVTHLPECSLVTSNFCKHLNTSVTLRKFANKFPLDISVYLGFPICHFYGLLFLLFYCVQDTRAEYLQ
jgi:hypothetical protein